MIPKWLQYIAVNVCNCLCWVAKYGGIMRAEREGKCRKAAVYLVKISDGNRQLERARVRSGKETEMKRTVNWM
jgi:hypothetical protein